MANPLVSSLPKYVDETREELYAKSILDSKTARMFTLVPDVKGETDLHLIDTDVTLQDASECGFNAVGTAEISKRTIKPAYLKVNMEYCDKNLLHSYAAHNIRIAAGQKELPYEAEFMDGIVNGINEKVEKMVWQGDSTSGDECDGMIKILTDASAPSVTGGTTAYDKIKEVYMAMKEEVASKEDAVIFVGAGLYRAFIQDLVAANLYHFDPSNSAEEYVLPATNVRVVKVNGLNDTTGYDYAVAGRLSNMFYGTDAMGDENKLELWFSQDDRTFKVNVEFTIGVQTAYPSEVVLGKWSK